MNKVRVKFNLPPD